MVLTAWNDDAIFVSGSNSRDLRRLSEGKYKCMYDYMFLKEANNLVG